VADGGMGTLLHNKDLVDSGNSKSLAGRIKDEYPSILIQHCLDHALDLINEKAL
jgi:hypothetical protein